MSQQFLLNLQIQAQTEASRLIALDSEAAASQATDLSQANSGQVENALGGGSAPLGFPQEIRDMFPLFSHSVDAHTYKNSRGSRKQMLTVTETTVDESGASVDTQVQKKFYKPQFARDYINGHHDKLKLGKVPADQAAFNTASLKGNNGEFAKIGWDDMFVITYDEQFGNVDEPVYNRSGTKTLTGISAIPASMCDLYDGAVCHAEKPGTMDAAVCGYRLHIDEKSVSISKFSHPTERGIEYLIGRDQFNARDV